MAALQHVNFSFKGFVRIWEEHIQHLKDVGEDIVDADTLNEPELPIHKLTGLKRVTLNICGGEPRKDLPVNILRLMLGITDEVKLVFHEIWY